MNDRRFVGYIGAPDFHDGKLIRVARNADSVQVLIRGFSGREYTVTFSGVESVTMSSPEGMVLYSLSELAAPDGRRCFVFANSEEASEASLEICSTDIMIESPNQ